MSVRAHRRRAARLLLTLSAIIVPRLSAQGIDSTQTARALVTRAERLASAGDTAAYRQALMILDSAEHVARIWPVFRTRAFISVAYAERLLAHARTTGTCADAQHADQVTRIAEVSVPNDDLSNSRDMVELLRRLRTLLDSVPSLRQRACGT